MAERQPFSIEEENEFQNLATGLKSESTIWQAGLMELSGMEDLIGAQIADWHVQGLGRLFAKPLARDFGIERLVGDAKHMFKANAYSLMLAHEFAPSTEQMALLIIVDKEKKDTYTHWIAKPIAETSGPPLYANNLRKFEQIFSPSTEPYFYGGEFDLKNKRQEHIGVELTQIRSTNEIIRYTNKAFEVSRDMVKRKTLPMGTRKPPQT